MESNTRARHSIKPLRPPRVGSGNHAKCKSLHCFGSEQYWTDVAVNKPEQCTGTGELPRLPIGNTKNLFGDRQTKLGVSVRLL